MPQTLPIKPIFSYFNPLLELAKVFQAPIHILYVRQNHRGISDEELIGKKSTEIIFEGCPHEYVTIEDPVVTHGINKYLQSQSAELLAMVAHKHTFLERVFSKNHTTAMCYETHVPLLILQDKG